MKAGVFRCRDTLMGGNKLAFPAQKGFTLIEVIVALSIVSLLTLSSAYLLNTNMNTAESVTERSKALAEFSTAVNMLRRDMEQLTARYYRDLRGVRNKPFANTEMPALLFSFVRSGKVTPPGLQRNAALERIAYTFEEGHLWRFSSRVLDGTAPENWHKTRLISDVSDVSFWLYVNGSWQKHNSFNTYEEQFPIAAMLMFESKLFGRIQVKALLSGELS